jgi:hypothetical protein
MRRDESMKTPKFESYSIMNLSLVLINVYSVVLFDNAKKDPSSIDAGKCFKESLDDPYSFCLPSLICIGAMKVKNKNKIKLDVYSFAFLSTQRAYIYVIPIFIIFGQAGTFELKQWLSMHKLVATSDHELHFFGSGQGSLSKYKMARKYLSSSAQWKIPDKRIIKVYSIVLYVYVCMYVHILII